MHISYRILHRDLDNHRIISLRQEEKCNCRTELNAEPLISDSATLNWPFQWSDLPHLKAEPVNLFWDGWSWKRG